jgi:hypothetical protein
MKQSDLSEDDKTGREHWKKEQVRDIEERYSKAQMNQENSPKRRK